MDKEIAIPDCPDQVFSLTVFTLTNTNGSRVSGSPLHIFSKITYFKVLKNSDESLDVVNEIYHKRGKS